MSDYDRYQSEFERSQEAARAAAFVSQNPSVEGQVNAAIPDFSGDEAYRVSRQKFMGAVYDWMVGGLAISAALAWTVSHSAALLQAILPLLAPLAIAELVLVIVMGLLIEKMSPAVMGVCFVAYSAMTGLALAPICLIYKVSSLALTFGVTAGVFLAMSVYGRVTKRDLSRWGSFLFMGLIGVLVGGLANLFLGSGMIDFVVTCAGILVFAGLTAYDTKKLSLMHAQKFAEGLEQNGDGTAQVKNLAIWGALSLYLDFINLFLKLLSLFGRRR